MSLLQLIIIITGFVFLLFSLDLYERKKFNLLHFLVFFCGTGLVVLFVVREDLLQRFGGFFGLASGADVLVYLSIIFLFYLYFEQLNAYTKHNILFTRLVSNLAVHDTHHTSIPSSTDTKDNYCFLIRAYNEASVIATVLKEIAAAGFTRIVVCDDGSTDATASIVRDLQQTMPGLVLLQHVVNRGPGAANQTLFARARRYARSYDITWFVTYDADGQMQIADMQQFMQTAQTGQYTVLLGSRFMEGGAAHNISWIRRIILRGSKFVTLVFNKIYVTDPTNGYKVIHRDAIQQIQLEADGFVYASEFLEQVQKKKLRRTEVPVKIRYTDYSMAKGQRSSNAWKILQNLIYKALFYK